MAAAQRGNKASLHTAAEHSGNPAAGKTTRGERDAPSRLPTAPPGQWEAAAAPRTPIRALQASGQSECRERQWAGGAV